MAKYNTFVVLDCKRRKNVLVTSSARKANDFIKVGIKIEVWNENKLIETIYYSKSKCIKKYIIEEKRYVGEKQKAAERRNDKRKNK